MGTRQVAKAKVATLISETKLAINVGGEGGIEEGDLVILNKTVEVIDPDSQERLGSVNLPKGRLVVSLVAKKYSVARVTSRVASGSNAWPGTNVFNSLKELTLDEEVAEDDDDFILIEIGEEVLVRREDPAPAASDDPPF